MSYAPLDAPVANPFDAAPLPVPPPADDPVAAMEAMEAACVELAEDAVDDPILPCQRPWFEVTLLGDGLRPAAGAPCTLNAGGVSRAGTLDGFGYVRFDDVEVDCDAVEARVTVEQDRVGHPVGYTIDVVPRGTLTPIAVEDAPEAAPAEDVLGLVFTGRVRPEPEDDR